MGAGMAVPMGHWWGVLPRGVVPMGTGGHGCHDTPDRVDRQVSVLGGYDVGRMVKVACPLGLDPLRTTLTGAVLITRRSVRRRVREASE